MQEETEQPGRLSLLSKLLLCFCKRKCWVVTENLDKNVYPVPFRWYQLLFGVLGIIVYIYDVGSDILLAYQYQEMEMWTAFILSTTFIVFPFLVSNTVIVYFDFYFDNNQRIALRRRDCESVSRVYCIPTMCTCPMMLGQIVSNIEYMSHGWRSRCVKIDDDRRQHIYGLKEQHHVYVCIIRMMESFIEAIPQLIFQLYFILTETDRSTSDEDSLLNSSYCFVKTYRHIMGKHAARPTIG